MTNKYLLKNGLPIPGTSPIKTLNEARTLANEMYASGHYPAGLGCCFVSGINGDWEDGICPFYGTSDCTCDEDVREVFEEILKEKGLTLEEYRNN